MSERVGGRGLITTTYLLFRFKHILAKGLIISASLFAESVQSCCSWTPLASRPSFMWCWYRCFAALYLWVTWAISVFICRSESASLSKSAKASFNGSINVYEKDATRCQFNLFLAPPQQKNKPTFFKCSNRLRMGFCVSRVSCILSMCLGNASKAVLMFFTFRWSCSNQKIISYWFKIRVRKYF